MKKITKTRLVACSKKLSDKIKKAEKITDLVRLHRRLNQCTIILNKHHNAKFKIEQFKPVPFRVVLKLNESWQRQRETRRALIQSHHDFCCPVSGRILDLDSSFILKSEIFDFSAIEKFKPEKLTRIDISSDEFFF